MGTLRDRARRKRGADGESVRTPRLFQLRSTLVDAVEQEPKPDKVLDLPDSERGEMAPAVRAVVEALLTRKKRKRGRPRKMAGEDFDTKRAGVIYEAARQFPPGKLSIRKWIEISKDVGKERGGECAKLFPIRKLEYSVSRGLRKLGVKRGWNRKNLRINKT